MSQKGGERGKEKGSLFGLSDREDEARDRLSILLKFVQEISSLSSHNNEGPRICLKKQKGGKKRSERGSGNDSSSNLVIWERDLKDALELKCSDGSKAVTLHSRSNAPFWFRVRRSSSSSSSPSSLSRSKKIKSAANFISDTYKDLFEVRQSALREGKGVQLVVGVGLIRWKISAKQIVEHPLVMIPAELQLGSDGAFVVRMAEAAKASLFMFPGIIQAAPALAQLDKTMKDYRYYLSPPHPADRDAWEPLLVRAAHCLHSSGVYVAHPPKTRNGSTEQARDAPQIFNTFVIFATNHRSGQNTVSKDAAALAAHLHGMPPGTLPHALGRLAGIFDLPVDTCAFESDAAGSSNGDGDSSFSSTPTKRSRMSFCSRIMGGMSRMSSFSRTLTTNDAALSKEQEKPMLYFGLPSNKQQASVVEALERNGAVCLVGPPGVRTLYSYVRRS